METDSTFILLYYSYQARFCTFDIFSGAINIKPTIWNGDLFYNIKL